MKQKKIIIIGASSGLGKEMALLYAQQQHLVAITGRRNQLLEEIKAQYPEHIITLAFDVMGSENAFHIKALIKQLGGLDLLIYNAGYGAPSKDLDWQIDKITINTNVSGFTEIINLAFNFFSEQGHGQIAVTSSVAALRGNSWAPAYSASKAFMSNYAEGLNIKAKRMRKDIIITDIKPGFLDTKPAEGHGRFWVATTAEAAKQAIRAIAKKKRVAYIIKRWWLVAHIMKLVPFWLYRRIA